MDFTVTTICIKMTQILSRAYKRLSSARALRQSTKELVEAVTELDQEVNALKRSIEHVISLDEPLDTFPASAKMSMFQSTLIYFVYYELLFEIHSPLMLPWVGHTSARHLQAFQSEFERSCSIVAETARAAILASRFVHLNANSLVM